MRAKGRSLFSKSANLTGWGVEVVADMMTYPGLIVEDEGAIRIVTLDRADSFNALDVPLIEALTRCFQNLCDRQDIRVVLLRANGKHFCAGVNLRISTVFVWSAHLLRKAGFMSSIQADRCFTLPTKL